MIFWAYTSPMPDKAFSSSAVAELMSTSLPAGVVDSVLEPCDFCADAAPAGLPVVGV
jgi:hypothetical protein